MKDGLLGKCKACTKADAYAHRAENIEEVREYDRKRAKLPARKKHIKKTVAAWEKKFPGKARAQTAVGNAVRDGRLVKGPCAVCGSTIRVHGHHTDYRKKLDVTWLCPAHHKQAHKELNA